MGGRQSKPMKTKPIIGADSAQDIRCCVVGMSGIGKSSFLAVLQNPTDPAVRGHLGFSPIPEPFTIFSSGPTLLAKIPAEIWPLVKSYDKESKMKPGKIPDFTKEFNLDGIGCCHLKCVDIHDDTDFPRPGPSPYRNTDFFVICFSYKSKRSFNAVTDRFIHELKHHCMSFVPFYLVGLCSDIPEKEREVSDEEVQKLVTDHYRNLHMLFKVSAKNNDGVTPAFKKMIEAFVTPPPPDMVYYKNTKYDEC